MFPSVDSTSVCLTYFRPLSAWCDVGDMKLHVEFFVNLHDALRVVFSNERLFISTDADGLWIGVIMIDPFAVWLPSVTSDLNEKFKFRNSYDSNMVASRDSSGNDDTSPGFMFNFM